MHTLFFSIFGINDCNKKQSLLHIVLVISG